jgi:hypothetical protein
VTDITYIHTVKDGWCYFASVMDLKIRQVVNDKDEKPVDINISNKKSTRIREAQNLELLGLSEGEISLQLKMDIRTVKKYLTLDTNKLPKDASQEKHEQAVTKNEKNIAMVRNLKDEGHGIRQIARVTGLPRQTVKRYLNPSTSAIYGSYGVSRGCPLAPFHSIIDKLLISGKTFKSIEEYIRDNGYTGSASAIRMYTTKKRRLVKESIESEIDKYELIDLRYLIKLLYKPIDKAKELSV